MNFQLLNKLQIKDIYKNSVTKIQDTTLLLVKKDSIKKLVVMGNRTILDKFEGEITDLEEGALKICDLISNNAEILRDMCPFTKPVPIGMQSGFGFGDRLGNATVGHIKAVKKFKIIPIFAQQSIRELSRTGRTPQEVIDSAAWAVFEDHFVDGYGADADHLKTLRDIEVMANAGFTMFTIDPSDYIENRDEVIKHVVKMYNYLKELKGDAAFDFEVSVDETSYPTTAEDHIFIIRKLRESGVNVTSLAPRFVGQFQKGIDYIGNIELFRKHLVEHCNIAKDNGGYKLSIHSGSDKFSVYPVIGEVTEGNIHVKTAGTSYLEAIKTVAETSPDFYRELHNFALKRFEKDRASYHVTTDLRRIPDVKDLKDSELPELMNQIDARQLMHITYGSVLNAKDKNGELLYKNRLMKILNEYEDIYYKHLDSHLSKHLEKLGVERKQRVKFK